MIGLLPGGDDGAARLAPGADELDAAFDGELAALLAVAGATGKADEVVKLPTRGTVRRRLLVAVGLGKPGGDGDADAPSRSDGRPARRRGRSRAPSTRSARSAGIDLAAAAEGSLLGAYAFTTYRTNGNAQAPLARLGRCSPTPPTPSDVLAAATAVAEAVRTARDLVNTPPNDLYPETFAARARELAEAAGLEVEVLDDAALAEAGFGGVLGVGQGSSRKPRLVRLRWAGGPSPRAHGRARRQGHHVRHRRHLDQARGEHGPHDLRHERGRRGDRHDGARGHAGAARRGHRDGADGREHAQSDTAYRPGDVLRMYGGRTVEVLNTDAEGRLILADAIVRAGEDSPDYLIETSTLTGAQLVALGMRTTGSWASEAFRDRVAALARACGEDGWAMPLPEHIRADLDSRVADLANVTGPRWGGMLVAGTFLREFVPDGLPWAHLDIAGPSFHTGSPYGYTAKGGTGVPVRTLVAVLQDIAANG